MSSSATRTPWITWETVLIPAKSPDVTPTASPRASSRWTVWNTPFLLITVPTTCTAAPTASPTISEDGEEGYPGNLKAVAHYTWGEDNSLKLIMTAETDKPTVVNLTNHAYFNLDGEGSGSVLNHKLELNASQWLPTDETLIPLGAPEDVAGTPMDFVEAKPIGQDIQADFPALKFGKGYDNCYLIDGYMPGQLSEAAQLWAAKSGRKLTVLTTQPAVAYEDYDAVAIECQHAPDSPNHPDYPSTVLRPGEVFEEAIIYFFER